MLSNGQWVSPIRMWAFGEQFRLQSHASKPRSTAKTTESVQTAATALPSTDATAVVLNAIGCAVSTFPPVHHTTRLSLISAVSGADPRVLTGLCFGVEGSRPSACSAETRTDLGPNPKKDLRSPARSLAL